MTLAIGAPVAAQEAPTDATPSQSATGGLSPGIDGREPLTLTFPIASIDTRFDDTFGAPRPGDRTHQGTDLIAEKGTPVLAIADGRIARITKGARSGYYVMIDHGNGYTSWYMHLDNDTPGTDDGRGGAAAAFPPELTLGAPVAAGDVVGFVGDSGNAENTVPHVHFELRYKNRALDAYRDLVAAYERLLIETEIEAGETPFK